MKRELEQKKIQDEIDRVDQEEQKYLNELKARNSPKRERYSESAAS